MKLVSNCCGAVPWPYCEPYTTQEGVVTGICNECKEHCEFDEDEDEKADRLRVEREIEEQRAEETRRDDLAEDARNRTRDMQAELNRSNGNRGVA